MLSTAEAKFLGNSATAIMSLQKVTPQATVILPRYRSMYVVVQWIGLLSKCTYQQKKLGYFNHKIGPLSSMLHLE